MCREGKLGCYLKPAIYLWQWKRVEQCREKGMHTAGIFGSVKNVFCLSLVLLLVCVCRPGSPLSLPSPDPWPPLLFEVC